jgi:type IV secretion system protein TrbL
VCYSIRRSPRLSTTLLLILGTGIVAMAQSAYAQAPGSVTIPIIDTPTRFTEAYRQAMGQWLTIGQRYATGLFAVLAAADLTWFGVEYWLNRYDFEGMMMASLRKIFAVGFFLAVVLNAGTWFPDIINGFTVLGKQGSGVRSLGPSVLLQQGVNIAGTIFDTASPIVKAIPGLGLGYFIGAAGVFAGFFLVSLQFSITLIDSFFAISLASYFIWLGGSRWTVAYVERYFAFCVAVGVKLMALYLLIGAGLAVTTQWQNDAAQNTGPVDNILNGWIIAIGALFFAMLCWHCSKLVSSVLGGSPTLTGSDAIAFFGAIASAGLGAAATAATAGTAGLAAGGALATGGGAAVTGGRAAASAARLGAGGGGITAGLSVPPVPQPKPPSTPPFGSGGNGLVSQPRPPGAGVAQTALKLGQQVANGARNLPPSGHSGGTPQSSIGH